MGTTVSAEVAELQQAAADGDFDKIKKMVRLSPDRATLLNARNAEGETALLLAAGSRKADVGTLRRDKIIEMLINFGASVTATESKRNWTALHYAASIGAVDTMKLLLQRSCSPYTRDRSGLLPQQIIASPVQGHQPIRRSPSATSLSEEEDLEVDSPDSVTAPKHIPDNQIILPKAHLVDAWPLLVKALSPKKWSLLTHVEILKAESNSTLLNIIVQYPSQEKYDQSFEGSDFIQFAYVKERPWNQTPVLGCYLRIESGTVLPPILSPTTEKDGTSPKNVFPDLVRVLLSFDTKDLPPRHSFRCLLVSGELSQAPETILAASDIFHTDMHQNIEIFHPQSFIRPEDLPAPQSDSSEDEKDDGIGHHRRHHRKHSHESTSSSKENGDENDGGPEADEEDDGYCTDEENEPEEFEGEEEDDGTAFGEMMREEAEELEMEFICGAPWEVNPLPNSHISALRDVLLKKKIMQLSKERKIWHSRWTELVDPPPPDFHIDTATVSDQAKLALESDPELSKARLDFVPSKISEKNFWAVYFWNVELVKLQVTDLLHTYPLPKEVKDCESEARPLMETLQPPTTENQKTKYYVPICYSVDSQMAVLREHTRMKLAKVREHGLDSSTPETPPPVPQVPSPVETGKISQSSEQGNTEGHRRVRFRSKDSVQSL